MGGVCDLSPFRARRHRHRCATATSPLMLQHTCCVSQMFFWCAAAPVRGAGFLKSTGEQVFAESSTVVVKRPMPVEALPRPWLSLANSPNMSKAEVWLLNDYYRHTPTVNKTYARAIIQFDTCRFVFYVHD